MSATDEPTDIRSRTRAGLSRLAGPWWIFLLTGIAWLIIAWVVLRFTPASVATVGVLLGVLFLVATINEFFIASVLSSWRWLHIVMGIIFSSASAGHSPGPTTRSGPLPRSWGCCSSSGARSTSSHPSAPGRSTPPGGWAWWSASWRSCSVSGPPSSTARYKERCCWYGSASSPYSAASRRSWSPSSSAAPSTPDLECLRRQTRSQACLISCIHPAAASGCAGFRQPSCGRALGPVPIALVTDVT